MIYHGKPSKNDVSSELELKIFSPAARSLHNPSKSTINSRAPKARENFWDFGESCINPPPCSSDFLNKGGINTRNSGDTIVDTAAFVNNRKHISRITRHPSPTHISIKRGIVKNSTDPHSHLAD